MDWQQTIESALGPGPEAHALIQKAATLPHGQARRLAHWVAGSEARRKGKGGCAA